MGPGHDGLASESNTDHYLLAYQPWGQILAQVIPPKPMMLVCRPQGGLEEVPVHPDYVSTPCLKEPQLRQLLELGCKLEAHFANTPSEVEWALDWQNRGLWLLESTTGAPPCQRPGGSGPDAEGPAVFVGPGEPWPAGGPGPAR